MWRFPILLLATWPTQVAAQATPSGQTAAPPPGADGRMFGHLPYAEVPASTLVNAPAGFAVGQPCRVQPAIIGDLTRLLAAEGAAGTGTALRGVSCYRSVGHQRAVFCRKGRGCADEARRAHLVGPPGYSEHATGYAIDFAVRPQGRCSDTSDCIADTAAGRWLLANAPRFGFELSFPAGNTQGVNWEPWHWRWVGVNGDAPEAARARALFARARANYPASPAVPPLVIRVVEQPPVPEVPSPAPAGEGKKVRR